VPIERCLMKAQRLARLLRDTDAQAWLDYETRGYPPEIDLRAELGYCAAYAFRWIASGNTIITTSLPEYEANVTATRAVLDKFQAPAITTPATNFLESSATKDVLQAITTQIIGARNAYSTAVSVFARMKSHLYRYAADTLVSLEFGDAAEGIFEAARHRTDEFVRSVAPQAAAQFLAAEERMAARDPESLSAAMTSCRRVIATVADALYPPTDAPYIDAGGRERRVGPEEYVNRLLAYVEQRIASASTKAIAAAQLTHLASRLDAVHAKACKGVHDDVAPEEARLVLIQTYLFLAEVARVAQVNSGPNEDAASGRAADAAAEG
jgi:hypothetical protein